MADILLVYSTTDGQTRRICERLQDVLQRRAHRATLVSIDDAGATDPARFDKVVIGARIRYGRHSPLVHDYVAAHRQVLDRKPSAFFSVNVVARKPGKDEPATNPYVQQFLHRTSWRPGLLGVFAGRIDYRLYSLRDRLVIRFIMWLTKGPTHADAAVEFTDWAKVDAFGDAIADL
jgi:menaquinone-dependent protoporphyrinogen oxidase